MELSKLTTEELDDIIKEVNVLRAPKMARLKLTGGAMSDGYVCACDDIISKLEEMKSKLNK